MEATLGTRHQSRCRSGTLTSRENIDNLKVKHDYYQNSDSEYIFKNCIFENIIILNDIYNWGIINVIKNDYGIFLELYDCKIPSWRAEYKIFKND